MRRRRLAETPMLHFSLWLRSSTKRFEDEGAAVPIWMGLVETDFVCRMPQDLGLLGRRSRFSGFVCPAPISGRALWFSEFGAGGKCPFALRQDAAGSGRAPGFRLCELLSLCFFKYRRRRAVDSPVAGGL